MIKLIAHTVISVDGWSEFANVDFSPSIAFDCDILGEFAGRECYQSFNNPSGKDNKEYIKHILDVGHESILEHASATFRVTTSRNTLLELERHRHLSFSVLSTRYVDGKKMNYVVHPATPNSIVLSGELEEYWQNSLKLYDKIYNLNRDLGKNLKQAREAARQVLPGNTQTMFVVTGNMRAWRYVINLRKAEGADLEIQNLSKDLLIELKRIAPNSFQDMEI